MTDWILPGHIRILPQMLIRINFPGLASVRSRLLLVLYCLLPAFSFSVFADDWYQVEVVLFEYTEPDADNEWWYENPGLPGRDQSIALITAIAGPVERETINPPGKSKLRPYLTLSKEDYQLAGVRRALEQSAEHRPLLHIAWQQPGLDSRNIRAIHLDNTRFEKKTAEQIEPEPDEEWDWPEYTVPDKVYDGIIRLRKSRYLHLDLDFAYFPDALEQPDLDLAEEASGNSRLSTDYVRLTESRRIKLDDLNYFDHPLFGLNIQVRRLASNPDL